jgi:GWxTD domain-containing protein
VIRRPALSLLAATLLAACGSWQRVGTQSEGPTPEESLTGIFDLTPVYQRLGRLVAGEPLPWVATGAYAAGPGDSALVIVALSLENRALSFQRETEGFAAIYRVELAFEREGVPPVVVARDETVRVATFQETLRDDESILFQQLFHLLPGEWTVRVTVRDRRASRQTTATRAVTVPAFAPGSVAAPILAYSVTGRARRSDPLDILLNPRGTVAYGGDTLLAYVEGYGLAPGTSVPVELIDAADSVVYRGDLEFAGGTELEGHVLRISPDSQPLGEFVLAVGSGDARRETRALVSFSSAWVITNFDDMLNLLRYFGEDTRVNELRRAAPNERPALWIKFYRETDPVPITPDNEALEEYFRRIAVANQRFRDEGVLGWRTDRGEVYMSLGEPDEGFITNPTLTENRVIRWSYINLRLTLYFQDETGFGRYRLDTESRSEFERVLNRVRRRES